MTVYRIVSAVGSRDLFKCWKISDNIWKNAAVQDRGTYSLYDLPVPRITLNLRELEDHVWSIHQEDYSPGDSIVDVGLHHSILPLRGGMTGQSAPAVLACWSL